MLPCIGFGLSAIVFLRWQDLQRTWQLSSSFCLASRVLLHIEPVCMVFNAGFIWSTSSCSQVPQCLHGPFSWTHSWRLLLIHSLWYFCFFSNLFDSIKPTLDGAAEGTCTLTPRIGSTCTLLLSYDRKTVLYCYELYQYDSNVYKYNSQLAHVLFIIV